MIGTRFLHFKGNECFEVSHTSKKWGSENSWTLDTCSNTSPHVSHATADAECCLPPGEYTLTCKDSYGDGWHGGYVTIEGKNYCEKFSQGSSETHQVLVGEDTVPDGKVLDQFLTFVKLNPVASM